MSVLCLCTSLVDPIVIEDQLPTVLALLGGLIAFKAVIITALGPFFNLTKAESIRTGMILSGGGEFAFVVLTLADRLHVIPDQLAKILVGVVVMSMALTPTLSQIGDKLAEIVQEYERKDLYQSALSQQEQQREEYNKHKDDTEYIVVCGFTDVGKTIAGAIEKCMGSQPDDGKHFGYIAFDLDPSVVVNQYRAGKKILYGDGSQPLVLSTAGISNPKAFVVTYEDTEAIIKAVERLHQSFPSTPIFARFLCVFFFLVLFSSVIDFEMPWIVVVLEH